MEIRLPEKSSWYGYCNMHDYRPCTDLFIGFQVLLQNNDLEDLKKAMKDIEAMIDSYTVYTEYALIINLLSWDLYNTEGETSERGAYLADEYYNIRDRFYKKFENNKKAKDYFWEMTD